MSVDFSPSVNIVRDFDRQLEYIPTANSRRIYNQIVNDYALGIHAFIVIGSYGTGKSAFLLAFERTLTRQHSFFPSPNGHFNGVDSFRFINVVGAFDSLDKTIRTKLDISVDEDLFSGLDRLTDSGAVNNSCVVLVVDEFGKYLEHAAETNPKREMYFVQQLAEYANDPSKNFLFISVLHQSFNAYAAGLTHEDREEWTKVKGRLKELTFNEPVEQLLELAANHVAGLDLPAADTELEPLIEAITDSRAYPHKGALSHKFASKLRPFDLLSASVLTQALQAYGQNDRSLFTFLNANEHLGLRDYDVESNPFFNLACVHDYLAHNYHSLLSTVYNPHHGGWGAIRSANERVDAIFDENRHTALKLVKSIGLLNIFAPTGSKINADFLSDYGAHALGCQDIDRVLARLETHKIIRYVGFKDSFVLFEGTDLNIDEEILNAGAKIDAVGNIVPYLQRYFEFPYLSAKAASYRTGTPRFFEYRLSEEPLAETPEGVIDGFINLIFTDTLTNDELLNISQRPENHATLYVHYRKFHRIRTILFEIEKVDFVMAEYPDDRVAQRQLKEIKDHEIEQLNKHVLDSLVANDGDIVWASQGTIHRVASQRALNQLLSEICDTIYPSAPTFRNELFNRHQVSSAAATARRYFFRKLVEYWDKPDLGFPVKKFPAEKTLYLSLLRKTGIHQEIDSRWLLDRPTDKSFAAIWALCEHFLEESKVAPKQVADLVEALGSAPFKLKQGLIDVWVPLYIFMRRENLALYHQGTFVTDINDATLDLMRRSPQRFQVKGYTVDGVRQRIFNRVRTVTDKETVDEISSSALLESVGELIGFYRQLPDYTKNTSRLNQRTLRLRDTLALAKEPDRTFFEELPQALGLVDLDDEQATDEQIDIYVRHLREGIEELTQNFDGLVGRIEEHLLSLFGQSGIFPEYRDGIRRHYEPLRVHVLLPKQKVFYTRLMSPIDDRVAWISSLVQAVLGKQVHRLRDEDEAVAFDSLTEMIQALDNLCILTEAETEAEETEVAVRVEITTLARGNQRKTVRIPINREKEIHEIEVRIRSALGGDAKINVSALARLFEETIGE